MSMAAGLDAWRGDWCSTDAGPDAQAHPRQSRRLTQGDHRLSGDHPCEAEVAAGIGAHHLPFAGDKTLHEVVGTRLEAHLAPQRPVPPPVVEEVGVVDLDGAASVPQ